MVNGDLISRSALMEALVKEVAKCDKAMVSPSFYDAMLIVDAQPTAYDVEKVVEELRKHHEEEMVTRNPIISLDSAISIIRNGGKG